MTRGGTGAAVTRRALAIVSGGVLAAAAGLAGQPALRPVQVIPLPGVEGRIDHLAFDPYRKRLLVAALGSGTVEVLDLATGTRLRSLTGFHEPQGIGFARGLARVFVANGADGTCAVLDAVNYRLLATVPLGDDADNVRVDLGEGRVYVGYGAGGLAVLDARTGAKLGAIELPGHPESFQLEEEGTRIFVNVPSARRIAVIDRELGRVVGSWPLKGIGGNFPMALDEKGHRLFVGCRNPAEAVAFDTETGSILGVVTTDGDADDLFLDRRRKLLYLSSGSGHLDVIDAARRGSLQLIARIATAAGARTSLLAPSEQRLYLAVPHRGKQAAEIRVFDTSP